MGIWHQVAVVVGVLELRGLVPGRDIPRTAVRAGPAEHFQVPMHFQVLNGIKAHCRGPRAPLAPQPPHQLLVAAHGSAQHHALVYREALLLDQPLDQLHLARFGGNSSHGGHVIFLLPGAPLRQRPLHQRHPPGRTAFDFDRVCAAGPRP